MFEKWDIPDNICDNYPIGLNSLDLFVGHSQQTKFLSDLLSNKSVELKGTGTHLQLAPFPILGQPENT